ncbi:hypothetical protein HD806DRAFT_388404 [Xylariaceae sp. AK1471]|nr:hypothetical protein HD806DRAFT_388404 [Xylariaceae sp. AK1471]
MPCEVVTESYGVKLPARYEIRRLGPEVEPWLRALTSYVLILDLRTFAPLYKDRQPVKRLLEDDPKRKTSSLHSLESGLSYGIFDKDYQFKRPESSATGGAVYWHEIDPNDPDLEVTGPQRLLDAMDFPLVSIALSYDKANPMPPEVLADSVQLIPEQTYMRMLAPTASSPDEKKKKTEEPNKGEVLARGGTATRRDYSGQGLMKSLSHFVMHEAHARGFKRIEVTVASEAVSRVWRNPPAPYRAEIVAQTDIRQGEIEVDGKIIKPFSSIEEGPYQNIAVYLVD